MPSVGVAERRQAFRARRTGQLDVYTRTPVVRRTLVTRIVACDVNRLPRNIIIITISRARFALASRVFAIVIGTPRRPRRWSIGRTGLPESGRQNDAIYIITLCAISASYERSDQQLNIISTIQVMIIFVRLVIDCFRLLSF